MAALRSLHEPNPDRDALTAWAGWGVFAPAFEVNPKGAWLHIADELEEIVEAGALGVARDNIDNSFYTPTLVTDTVFDLLASTGFTGGKVLEPGCGSGRFMAAAPDSLNIQWTGVELDPTAARMAAVLEPTATIICKRLQDVTFVTGTFDAVVGNVPFSSSSVFDPNFPSSSLHEYFLLRSLDAVREGGYVIVVTSRYTMDSEKAMSRLLQAAPHAELMGALRLPSGTFASAGTDVVTDILAFRKRADGEPHRGWADAAENREVREEEWPYRTTSPRLTITDPVDPTRPGVAVDVNAYWATYPDHVAGRMQVSTYFRNPLVVTTTDIPGDIAAAAAAVRTHLIPQAPRRLFDPMAELGAVPLEDTEGRKEGSFHVVDGILHEVTGGRLSEVRNNKELRVLVDLRDKASALLALESDTSLPDSAIDETRQAALTAYLGYVAKFGPLNRGTLTEGKVDPDSGQPTYTWRRPSMGGFRRDPDYTLVCALEHFDQDDGSAAPAPILLRRVNRAPEPITHADTPAEALSVTLGEGRGVDLNRIAGLLNLNGADAALDALGDLIYVVDGIPTAARDYLSGNVRAKLAAARAAAEVNPTYQRNVTALEAVQPDELGALDIRVSLGAPYLAAADVTAFASEVLGSWGKVQYTPEVAVWEVVGGAANTNASTDAELNYGTTRVSPMRLLEAALNGKSITVYDENWEYGRTIRVRNVSESIAAAEKQRALGDRFSTWVWEDQDRAKRIITEYNRRFNSHVVRRFDGAHLRFPGLAEGVTPWAHQRNAVDRIVSSERTLIGHPVGAGKTLSMVLSAMTLRRLGLAQKPLIAVPNHLLDQIVREAQQAFPTGKFLIAAKEDLAGERRRLFAARCATGEWDAVVMTHSVFNSLPVAPERERRWIEEQKADLRGAMRGTGETRSKGAKAIARAIRGLESRLETLRDGATDRNQVLFDHLGVDYIMVDEAHLYRRLSTGSTSRDSGLGSGSSKRATDLLLKIETLAERHPGKPIVALFTGTPWANTLAETWVWQRYLQPGQLESAGVKMFDPWVAAFVRYENAVEVAPDGSGFRMQKRPVGMKNLPELKTMLGAVADIVSADQIGLERPEATVHNVVAQPTPDQHEYVQSLAERAEAIHRGHAVRPGGGDDSMLLVCNDGRKAALDPVLVGLDEVSAKLQEAAATIAGIYRENRTRQYGASETRGAFQLALLDLGTPHPGDAAVYGRLRGMLAARGVPAEQIRFVHEAKTDKARAHLFAQAREGAISVLLGSTSKVGIGTNIQTRLAALHHIDPPWTPAEVEQREGRALRPGNLNQHVDIYRYVTESTFDAYVWQALERKARSFAALYDPTVTAREVEDISATALSFGEVKALAAGNPLLLEQAKAASEVGRLRLMRSVHMQGVNAARKKSADYRRTADSLAAEAALMADALHAVERSDQSQPEPNLYYLNSLSAAIAKNEVASFYNRGSWRGLALRNATRGKQTEAGGEVEVLVGYRELAHIIITRKVQRRGAEAVLEDVLAQLNAMVTRFPDSMAHCLSRADQLRAEAALAEATADGAAFEQEHALDEALFTLARIDALIAAEAAEPQAAAAAAA